MINIDVENIEKILQILDNKGYLFSEFQFNKENECLRLLGRGGFSTVYEMIDRKSQQNKYALKVIGFERHLVTLDDFLKTVNMQTNISEQSPYVMRILDKRMLLLCFNENGEIEKITDDVDERWTKDGLHLQFILMEKLDEIIVKDKFGRASLLRDELQNENEVLKFAIQIGQAILVAHDNKVLHRDIKIENIFWDDIQRKYKLGDFGIAKYVEDGNAETVVYTDGYGAPEIKRRLGDFYNVTADIYSFGITLYLLLNELRFPGSDRYVMNQVQYYPEYVFPAPKNASEQMTRIIRKMCNYKWEERYQSMEEVLRDLMCVQDSMNSYYVAEELELTNLTTETYHEKKNVFNEEIGNKKIGKSRAQNKIEELHQNSVYNKGCVKYFLVFTILFTLMMIGIQKDTAMIVNWKFLIFPLVVLVEAILQRVKEFHILFGILVLGVGIYSINGVGITISHIVLLLCVVGGIPLFMATSAVATVIWILLTVTEKIPIVEWIRNLDIGWIFLVLILLMFVRYVYFRKKCNKMKVEVDLIVGTCVWVLLLSMVAGIVLFALQRMGVIILPEIVQKIHLFWTGFLSLFFLMLFLGVEEGEQSEQETAVREGNYE